MDVPVSTVPPSPLLTRCVLIVGSSQATSELNYSVDTYSEFMT